MKRAYRSILVGVGMLAASLVLALVGGYVGSFPVTVLSLIIGIGGAVVAVRGMVEFLTEVY